MAKLTTANDLPAADAHLARESLIKIVGAFLAEQGNGAAVDQFALLQQMFGDDACRRLGFCRYPAGFLLSIVIPVYNEATTIEKVIDRVRAVELPCEMIIVDDGSTDGTRDVLDGLRSEKDLTIVLHDQNQGKGAAVRTGFANVRGDIVAIQDADMEYDPRDLRLLIQPIVDDQADVVYGSRFSSGSQPESPRWHQAGNQLITRLSNWKTGLNFSDVETCYKVFRRELVDRLTPGLRETRFGIEIELTAKLAKMDGVRFYERPISYAKRTYAEGKKIGLRDAFRAAWCIMKY